MPVATPPSTEPRYAWLWGLMAELRGAFRGSEPPSRRRWEVLDERHRRRTWGTEVVRLAELGGRWSWVSSQRRCLVLSDLAALGDPDDSIVIKMVNGYNVGVHVDRVTEVEELGWKEAVYKIPEKEFRSDRTPKVRPRDRHHRLLLTRTGAVILMSILVSCTAVPIADIRNLTTRKLLRVFSENMARQLSPALAIGEETPPAWTASSSATHHTMGTPPPSFHSWSRTHRCRSCSWFATLLRPASSDAALNLIHAVRTAAYGDIAEVMIAGFARLRPHGLRTAAPAAARCTPYRSTFRTVGDIPLPPSAGQLHVLVEDYRRRDKSAVRVDPVYDERTTILYYYPGMHPDLVDALVEKGYHGIVIAGTGLGHVNKPLYPALKRAIEQGVHVVMAVQTLWGYAQMYVYDTGRDPDIGIVPLDNMLPETALMKLSWVLAHTRDHAEVARMMTTPIAHEITPREPHNGYLIMQGGLPEIEEWIKTHWK